MGFYSNAIFTILSTRINLEYILQAENVQYILDRYKRTNKCRSHSNTLHGQKKGKGITITSTENKKENKRKTNESRRELNRKRKQIAFAFFHLPRNFNPTHSLLIGEDTRNV